MPTVYTHSNTVMLKIIHRPRPVLSQTNLCTITIMLFVRPTLFQAPNIFLNPFFPRTKSFCAPLPNEFAKTVWYCYQHLPLNQAPLSLQFLAGHLKLSLIWPLCTFPTLSPTSLLGNIPLQTGLLSSHLLAYLESPLSSVCESSVGFFVLFCF